MEIYDFIVIGSGPSGCIATYSLKEKKTLLLDVGVKPTRAIKKAEKANELQTLILGENFDQIDQSIF